MECRAPLLLTLVLLIPSAALAEVELTPAIGFRAGGQARSGAAQAGLDAGPAYGLTLDIGLAPEKWLVVLWSRQNTEFGASGIVEDGGKFGLAIDYLQVGGAYRPGSGKKTRPFVMATLGVTVATPEPSGFDTAGGLSGMAGGGAKFVLSPRIGVRLEGRAYLTFTDISMSGVCGGVGCSVSLSGGGTLQLDGVVGLSIGF